MDLFEYQARDMFEAHGVPVLAGATATTPEQARAAAEEIGARSGGVTVVKAQVKTGGRGKAGGVKVAKTADEAQQHAEAILGMDIKGHTVGTVMIAQGAQIAEEYYFSILLDRANRTYLAMCSKEGGMDIEQLAVERPEALARVAVDPNVGIDEAKAREIVDAAGFDDETGAAIVPVLQKLWEVYRDEDATLVEVNPLVKTEDGDIVALDGKVTLDENADFRHPDHAALEDKAAHRPARGRGQGEGPQLRQARRLRRHHRQRRRPGHVDPRRRRLRGRGVPRVSPSRPTSSTSAVAPRPRSWPTGCTSSSATSR